MKSIYFIICYTFVSYIGYSQCPIIYTVSGGGSICPSNSATVTLSASQKFTTYVLYLNGSAVSGSSRYSNSFTGPLTWSVSNPGSYTVNASNENCSNTWMDGTASVTEITPTAITITESGEACESSGYLLSASGGGNYTWHSSVTLDQSQVHNSTFSPEQSGDYWVTGVNNCGTSQTSNIISVTLTPRVWTPSIPSGTTIRCKGSGTDSYTSSASYASSYSWSVTSGSNSISSSGVVTWDPNFAGTERVTVTAYGCGGSTTSRYIDVSIGNIAIANVSGGATVCAGTSANIVLTASSGTLDPNVLYTLRLNGNSLPGPKYGADANGNPVTTLTWTQTSVGTYTITATGNGCSNVSMSGSATISNITPTTIAISSSGQACESSGYLLSASSGSTYTWHSSVTLDQSQIHNSTFSPEQSGDYWVTGVNNCGTSQTSNIISVTLTPRVWTPSIPSGTTIRCKGSGTDSYTSSASYATSYSWSITGSSNSISSGGVVTWDPNFTGTARVTVTASGCGGSTATRYVDVNVGDIAIANVSGGATVCAGTSANIVLTASSGMLDPNVLYTLRLNGNTLAGPKYGGDASGNPVASLTWSQSVVGTYTITATGNGCSNVSMNGSAIINLKQPTLLSYSASADPLNRCEGDVLTITATGATNYLWYLRAIPGSNEPDLQLHPPTPSAYAPSESGTYYVKGTDVNCGTAIQSSDIVVNFYPYPDKHLTPTGKVLLCSSCSQNIKASTGYTYQWKKNGIDIPVTASSYSTNVAGAYSVAISFHGCTTLSDTLQVAANQFPVANAGADQILYSPATSTQLAGSAYDLDGSIQSFQWTQTSGSAANLAGAQTQLLTVSGLNIGNYTFSLKVTDNLGDFSTSNVNVVLSGVSNNYNYVKEENVLVPGKTLASSLQAAPIGEKHVTTTYIDGIGRSSQTVTMQGSPAHLDIVQPMIYDEFGREAAKYLPFVSTEANGLIKTFIDKNDPQYHSGSQYQFYQTTSKVAQDAEPFAETIFEASPLNRVLKQGAPGSAWQPNTDPMSINDHTIKKRYETNGVTEVLLFKYTQATGLVTLESNETLRFYSINQLYANKTLDEHNNEVIEYVDKQGRTVCKKVQYGTTGTAPNLIKLYAATYYVYDDFGNLAVVLPPEACKDISSFIQN